MNRKLLEIISKKLSLRKEMIELRLESLISTTDIVDYDHTSNEVLDTFNQLNNIMGEIDLWNKYILQIEQQPKEEPQ